MTNMNSKNILKKKIYYILRRHFLTKRNWLKENKIKLIKIGSGETNNIPFIKHVCSFKTPMIVSTGMNSLDTIKKTVNLINKNQIPHVLLHCVNLYQLIII